MQTIDHFTVVPVVVADSITTDMILDTGIGLTVLSRELCERLGCVVSGEHTGRRMSGQTVVVPLARIPALSIAGHRREDVQVGVVAAEGLLPPGVDGILGLGLFEQSPFTLDYRAGALVFEDERSLRGREAAGVAVAAQVERDGASVSLFTWMALPGGATARVEVDTGSNALILDERYMRGLGVDPADPAVEVVRGEDETAHPYLRVFAAITGAVELVGAPASRQDGPRVLFQRIIHEGLVGRDFLARFTVTFDLPRARIILGPPGPGGPPPTRER